MVLSSEERSAIQTFHVGYYFSASKLGYRQPTTSIIQNGSTTRAVPATKRCNQKGTRDAGMRSKFAKSRGYPLVNLYRREDYAFDWKRTRVTATLPRVIERTMHFIAKFPRVGPLDERGTCWRVETGKETFRLAVWRWKNSRRVARKSSEGESVWTKKVSVCPRDSIEFFNDDYSLVSDDLQNPISETRGNTEYVANVSFFFFFRLAERFPVDL